MTVYFPSEIDMKYFSILEKVDRGTNSWSCRLLYKDKPLTIQTPILPVAFNLNGYKYNENSTKENFSISVTLDPKIDGVQTLKEFIETIDNTVINTFKEEFEKNKRDTTFISSIKISKDVKFEPTLRCKMVSNTTRFKCKITINNKSLSDEIKTVKAKVCKGTKVKLVLQLNPVWCCDNKYGVSWQVLALNIEKPDVEFRKQFC